MPQDKSKEVLPPSYVKERVTPSLKRFAVRMGLVGRSFATLQEAEKMLLRAESGRGDAGLAATNVAYSADLAQKHLRQAVKELGAVRLKAIAYLGSM